MMLPTYQEIEALHRKYAPTEAVFELIFTHCHVVYDIAIQLMARNMFKVDAELVRVGCLLHDIGIYPLFGADGKLKEGVYYIQHGVEGAKILQRQGFPQVISRVASHHTGVGLSKEDVIQQNLPLPVADYLAETIEEALIMYADKFHSKTDPPYFNSFERYKRDIARFGADKVKKFEQFAQQFGIPHLEPLVAKYGYAMREA